MRRLASRASRMFPRIVAVAIVLSLVFPSPLVCSAFAAGLPRPAAQIIPPAALPLLDELDRLLAADARPQVKALLSVAAELQKTCGNKTVDMWVESILAGPLAGLPEDTPSLGLAFDFQLVDELPYLEAHDITLTDVIVN